jgi:hypothetical protein
MPEQPTQDDTVQLAISLGFSVIGLILEYLRTAGVDEATIDANWETTKAKLAARPSATLPEV